MSTVIQPDELSTMFREINRRLRSLESGNNSTFVLGGNFGYQMVDPTFSARCRFLIPTRTLQVSQATLNFSIQPFRSGASSAASSGTTGLTSAGHTHSYSNNTGNESAGHTHGTPSHQHGIATQGAAGVAPGGWSQLKDGTGAVVMIAGDYTAGVTWKSDTSGSGGSGGASGTHVHSAGGATAGQSGDHTHSIPGSAISLPNSLYETGMAQGCHVTIDGTDVTTALGGPWGTGAALDVHDLDVTQWLNAVGWHELRISSTTIGGVFAQIAVYATLGG